MGECADFVQESFFSDHPVPGHEIVSLDRNASRQMNITKSNLLVEAHYDLSPMENKLMLLAMANIRKDQTALREQVFNVRDLCKCLGIRHQNASRDLHRVSKSLMKKQLEIRDPESEDWVLHQWVSRTSVKNGEFFIKFDDGLRPYLLGLVNRFTQYQLEKVLQMSSAYAIRLYELLKQVEDFGFRTFSLDPQLTKNEPWGDFARLMSYNPKTYSRYSNIKQRILNPAIEQILNLTEFRSIDIVERKHQRKTVAITLTFKTQPVLEQFKESPLYKRMRSLRITDSTIRKLIVQFESIRIERNIDYIEAAYRWKQPSELAPLIVSAIQNDYANSSIGAEPQRKSPEEEDAGDSRATNDPDHALFKHCANVLEFKKVLASEKEIGRPFESYTEFTQYLMQSKVK
jgi:plasmid replication initiation protein